MTKFTKVSKRTRTKKRTKKRTRRRRRMRGGAAQAASIADYGGVKNFAMSQGSVQTAIFDKMPMPKLVELMLNRDWKMRVYTYLQDKKNEGISFRPVDIAAGHHVGILRKLCEQDGVKIVLPKDVKFKLEGDDTNYNANTPSPWSPNTGPLEITGNDVTIEAAPEQEENFAPFEGCEWTAAPVLDIYGSRTTIKLLTISKPERGGEDNLSVCVRAPHLRHSADRLTRLTMDRCRITDWPIYAAERSSLTMNGCKMLGAGIITGRLWQGDGMGTPANIEMTDCEVQGGGGVRCDGTLTATDCTFTESEGDGVYVEYLGSMLNLVRCKISSSTGTGVLCHDDAEVTLNRCIIKNNKGNGVAVSKGGRVSVILRSGLSGTSSLHNTLYNWCIINPDTPDDPATFISAGRADGLPISYETDENDETSIKLVEQEHE